ncbi:hypothetical protein [Spartinivicinus poritis]|uniref:Uncharacterized protein n=1 Tax=Spartinivicinus poritis TaxID=2994640 RepID=A0ABT5U2U2_9GAMM|nr:hypothetical protein [Spartinivicinus sp. A2-2]MDE1460688.1 hypothetical protein [Spartinivicinus sp. A2-2]
MTCGCLAKQANTVQEPVRQRLSGPSGKPALGVVAFGNQTNALIANLPEGQRQQTIIRGALIINPSPSSTLCL